MNIIFWVLLATCTAQWWAIAYVSHKAVQRIEALEGRQAILIKHLLGVSPGEKARTE